MGRLCSHQVQLLCVLLLASSCTTQGRRLLQYGWIAHPPPGTGFNSSLYQEAMTALATTILGQTQDPVAFAQSMAVAVQHWYPAPYFTLLCNLSSQCAPQLLGGPFQGQPARAQLAPIFGVEFGIWTFETGSLDHCSSMGSLSSWAFFGGTRSGDMGCQVQWA